MKRITFRIQDPDYDKDPDFFIISYFGRNNNLLNVEDDLDYDGVQIIYTINVAAEVCSL